MLLNSKVRRGLDSPARSLVQNMRIRRGASHEWARNDPSGKIVEAGWDLRGESLPAVLSEYVGK